jgi:hypothetical protein
MKEMDTFDNVYHMVYIKGQKIQWSIKHLVYTYMDMSYVHHNMIFIPLKRSH